MLKCQQLYINIYQQDKWLAFVTWTWIFHWFLAISVIMSSWNSMLSWAEHEKSFITSGHCFISAMKFSAIALLVLVSIVGLCQAQWNYDGYNPYYGYGGQSRGFGNGGCKSDSSLFMRKSAFAYAKKAQISCAVFAL